ncbi:MAG: TonB-dependent receptor [Desulfobacterales bacterium]|jgi:hemoglobin/transferrin/lactoferrin receptor protein|nr:TonB-dependent receptor [Desulfobacterales bacterium]
MRKRRFKKWMTVGVFLSMGWLIRMPVLAAEGVQYELAPVVVTATRTEKNPNYIPYSAQALSSEQLKNEQMVRTVPEALKEIPGIMVQKTAHGQGSPFIRGFTGFRTLFLIDGIRLNNSVFRDGPNQYWNTVDPLSVKRLEILKGPQSVLFGSDAVGGTVQAISVEPDMKSGSGTNIHGRGYYRYASAENANVGRAELSGMIADKLGVIGGYSYKDFGNVHSGGDLGELPKTGYDEWNADAKVVYQVTPGSKVTMAYQKVVQDDAWRTHKTIYGKGWEGTTVGNEKVRSLDQDRELFYMKYSGKNPAGWLDGLDITASYQTQEEEQYRVRSDNRSDVEGVDVGTSGLCAQLDTGSPIGWLTYGLEYYHDEVDSFLRKYKADGSFSGAEIQGPVADDASYDYLGAYFQDDFQVTDRLGLIAGIRYNYMKADADKVKDPLTGDLMTLEDDWTTLVSSLHGLYWLDAGEQVNLFAGISQGYRAPNLSDLTRYDTARSNELETPAPDLDPEEFVSYEIGVKLRSTRFASQLSYFYTDIRDMIVRAPTGRIIDGDNEVTKKNAGDGYIHGVDLNCTWRIFRDWEAFGAFTWMDGEVDSYPTSDPIKVTEPVSRLMPPTFYGGLRWEPVPPCWLEGYVTIAGKQDDLSASDMEDTQRIPPGGTPGYTVYGVRGGWHLTKNLTASAGIENITDEDYRIHGSGLNEPGRNFIATLEATF